MKPWEAAAQKSKGKPWQHYAVEAFSQNPNKEGTYEMVGPGGKNVHVPFSHVLDAGKAGLQITPEAFKTFTKDYNATLGPIDRLDVALAPEDETTWKGRGLNVLKGAAAGIENPIAHPVQTAATMGKIPTATGTIATPMGLFPNMTFGELGKFNRQEQQKAEKEQEPAAEEAAKHPVYTLSSIVGPALAYEGAAKVLPRVPGVEAVRELRREAAERVRGGLREKFGGGVGFTEKKAGEFSAATDKARAAAGAADEATEAKWGAADDINKARQEAHQEKLAAHQEKVSAQRKAHEEKLAAWNTKKADLLEKHRIATKETQEANAKALGDYLKEKEEIGKNNAAAEGIIGERQTVEKQIQDNSLELQRRIDQAEIDAKAANDAAWDAWRKKLANVNVDLTPVTDTIKAQEDKMNPQQVAEFRDIIKVAEKSGTDSPEMLLADQTAQNLGYKNFAEATKIPQIASTLQRVLPPDVWKAATQGISETPVTRLHGWKTQLENSVRRVHDGNVLNAIGQVLDSVRKLEDDVSTANNAKPELEAARKLHGPYKEAFVNKPTEPATAASSYMKQTAPEFASDAQLKELEQRLSHYDPEIARIGEEIRKGRQHLKELPSEKQARAMVKPVPEPPLPKPIPPQPELPPPPKEPEYAKPPSPPSVKPYPTPKGRQPSPEAADWTPERIKVLRENIKKYGATGQWVTRLVLGAIGEQAFSLLSSHPSASHVGVFSSGLLVGQGLMRLFSNIMSRDNIVDWLARPSAKDLEILKSLPPDQAERLRVGLEALRKEAELKGQIKRDFKMNPAVAAFLGGEQQKQATPQTLEEIRKEAEQRNPQAKPAAPGPQSYTHYFDPLTKKIIPVVS